MDHHFIARAMCLVTEDLLWKPRMAWARSRCPGAALIVRVGSGRKTYLSHHHNLSVNAEMTLTYGVKMVAEKAQPELMCRWLTARELHERRYFGGELNLLNVLTHTIAHEFGHFVQNVLGRRYDGSVHNDEFYTILDRIHSSGEGDRIRAALHSHCLQRGIDLQRIEPSKASVLALSGRQPDGAKLLTMKDIRVGEMLWTRDAGHRHINPVRVIEKRRTRIVVASIDRVGIGLIGYPAGFSKSPV